MIEYVKNCSAEDLLKTLEPESVDLFLIDPPYYNIVNQKWDQQWKNVNEYIDWFVFSIAEPAYKRLKPNGSFIFFGGLGSKSCRPFWDVCWELDFQDFLTYRNIITWKKRRGYGKKFDYLFAREEIAWYSKSSSRTDVTFNIPYTDVKRGYAGFNKKYPAKSEFKRVSNVWDDIPELMRPKRETQKPVALIDRLVLTHSNEGNLIVDLFSGSGTIAVSALKNNRLFVGCDTDPEAVKMSNERCNGNLFNEK